MPLGAAFKCVSLSHEFRDRHWHDGSHGEFCNLRTRSNSISSCPDGANIRVSSSLPGRLGDPPASRPGAQCFPRNGLVMDFRPRPRVSAHASLDAAPEARSTVDWALDVDDSKSNRESEFRRRDSVLSWPSLTLLFLVGFTFCFWVLPQRLENKPLSNEISVQKVFTVSDSHDGIVYHVDPENWEPSKLPKSPVVDMVLSCSSFHFKGDANRMSVTFFASMISAIIRPRGPGIMRERGHLRLLPCPGRLDDRLVLTLPCHGVRSRCREHGLAHLCAAHRECVARAPARPSSGSRRISAVVQPPSNHLREAAGLKS